MRLLERAMGSDKRRVQFLTKHSDDHFGGDMRKDALFLCRQRLPLPMPLAMLKKRLEICVFNAVSRSTKGRSFQLPTAQPAPNCIKADPKTRCHINCRKIGWHT